MLALLSGACNQTTTPTVSAPSPPQVRAGANCPGGLIGLECEAYKQGIQSGLAD